jgi:hypothetical protein
LDYSIENNNDAFHKDWIWLGMSTSVLMYLQTMSLQRVAFTALTTYVMIASKQLSITDLFLKTHLHTGITVTYCLLFL